MRDVDVTWGVYGDGDGNGETGRLVGRIELVMVAWHWAALKPPSPRQYWLCDNAEWPIFSPLPRPPLSPSGSHPRVLEPSFVSRFGTLWFLGWAMDEARETNGRNRGVPGPKAASSAGNKVRGTEALHVPCETGRRLLILCVEASGH